nr:cytospin-B [Nothobranchius furzeri]
MGNFTTKDNHGPLGPHSDTFHTPPTSPQSDVVAVIPSVPPFPPSSAVPAPSPCPALAIPNSVKKPQQRSPSTPIAPPDWSPPPPVTPVFSPAGSGETPTFKKPANAVAGRGEAPSWRNVGPPASPGKTSASQVKSVVVTPIKSPSPPSRNSLEQSLKEEVLRLSPLPGSEDKEHQSEELVELLEECRAILGVSASQDRITNTSEILKHLLTEVKSLKTTLQTERGEWLQFQADLQVAVSVADRLRAEAEEELAALRKANKDVERELASAHQTTKEAEMQLVSLQGELQDTRQRLAALAEAQEPEKPNGESKKSGRGRGLESKNLNEGMKHANEDARTDCKGVTQRYLRNLSSEDRNGADETRRTVSTERSRSLSRLPASSESLTVQNGTSQSSSTLGPTHKNSRPLKGRRSLDWQDSRSFSDAGKREESLNKYNSALSQMPPTKSQDGFSLLLRRHGGSKRNSLLRWCQNRTQGYESIDITNFSSSWADGLAFCAVYHTYLPSHIQYSALNPENKKENLSLAFKTGQAVGISPSLTVDEMLRVGGPDWQRVLSYVESIYRHFEM